MSVKTKIGCHITDGPSKGRLFDACKYYTDKNANIPLSFTIIQKHFSGSQEVTVEIKNSDVRVRFIGNDYDENDQRIRNGEKGLAKLILSGVLNVQLPSTPCCDDMLGAYVRCKFEATYDAYTRTGIMTITPP